VENDIVSNKLKIEINKSACCAYGLCAEICPDVYKLDANGIVYTDEEFVPEGMEELAEEGAAACPQLAIKLVEVEA
jgi:ferredoxin